ncbi:hypothetical protein EZM97_33745 [Dyella soli]|uniref:Uncharacterized protein n=1 Tax=Dyella soli TaxID=522319 RepID=A0A4R0YEG2_9GAMM|nr:hypothetical protein EZM97_33745 [Dyella soli]
MRGIDRAADGDRGDLDLAGGPDGGRLAAGAGRCRRGGRCCRCGRRGGRRRRRAGGRCRRRGGGRRRRRRCGGGGRGRRRTGFLLALAACAEHQQAGKGRAVQSGVACLNVHI